MSEVLVTGGGGFLGSHLVEKLLDLGHNVSVVDNFVYGNIKNIAHLNIKRVIPYNIVDRGFSAQFKKKLWDFDYIFHIAAQINLRESIKNPVRDAKINILGTLNTIKLAKKFNAKLIFASTGGAIYSPEADLPWTEISLADPQSPYGISKLAAEGYIKASGLDHCILRLANVYGPKQNPQGEAGVISIFLDRIVNQEPIYVFGDGKQTRDFIYVSDVVDAFVRSMEEDMTGIYNVSSGIETDINTIHNLIVDKMWIGGSPNYKDAVPGELLRSCLDSEKIIEMGWKPQVELSEGITKTINYFTKE